MIFETLQESNEKRELILVDGGFCRFHLRRDSQLTIHEIISQRPGVGTEMLDRLKQVAGATSILARCPADLSANLFYSARGFTLESTEQTRSGRVLNVWRLKL